MKRLILAATLLVVAFVPAGAVASTVSHQRAVQYGRAYVHARRVFGPKAVGCRLIGRHRTCHQKVIGRELMASIGVLHRMFAPAPRPAPVAVLAVASSATAYSPPAPAPVQVSSTGAGGVPGCASESGTNYSTGPANTNASSGATGRYQIIPSTAAGYGCNLSTPAGQDACAQTIYAHQGAGAWVGCGG